MFPKIFFIAFFHPWSRFQSKVRNCIELSGLFCFLSSRTFLRLSLSFLSLRFFEEANLFCRLSPPFGFVGCAFVIRCEWWIWGRSHAVLRSTRPIRGHEVSVCPSTGDSFRLSTHCPDPAFSCALSSRTLLPSCLMAMMRSQQEFPCPAPWWVTSWGRWW